MMRRNKDIRQMIKEAGLKHWQVAEQLGIDATTLCRWLRFQLDDDKRKAIIRAIQKLCTEDIA